MSTVFYLKFLFSMLISFLLTFYLVPVLAAFAIRLRVLDIPDGKIKKHEKATPYLGGIAVYIGFLISLGLVFPVENQILLFIVGATVLLFVGLIDDLLCLKPYQKFFGQSIAALCFLKAGFYLKELFFLSNYWNIPISFLWIISIINAFNLVDVMDGLATTIAMAASLSFIVIAFGFGHYNLILLLGSFFGALLAFFWYNKPSATIYLGDAGSLFIGGFLATIPFLFKWGLYNRYGFLSPVIILTLPLLEVGCLIIIRSYKRIPFYQGSPDHFSSYLKMNGWTVWEILSYTATISSILMVVAYAFAFNYMNIFQLMGIALLFFMIWVLMLCYKRKSSLIL